MAHQGSRRERESKINELLGFSRCGCERMFILSNEEILTQECNRSVSCQKLQILTAVKKKILFDTRNAGPHHRGCKTDRFGRRALVFFRRRLRINPSLLEEQRTKI